MNLLIKTLLFIFACCIFFNSNKAQTHEPICLIDSIIVVGNAKTKPFVILRELNISKGDTINATIIEQFKNRLYSLQLFNSVDIFTDKNNNNSCNLIIHVNERWFIYPVPVFGIKDHNWKKFYYGIGLLNTNFRGMDEKIFVMGTLGYEPSFQFYYRTPNLKFIKDGFYEVNLSISKIENRSVFASGLENNFYIKNYYLSSTLGKRFNLTQKLWFNVGYQLLSVEEEFSYATLDRSGIDKFPIIGFGYQYDTRDLNDFTTKGMFLSFHLRKFGILQEKINYAKSYFDLRKFIPVLSNITFAFRNYLNLSHGKNIPSYNLSHIGYSEKIRGHFTKIFEGENLLNASAEVRMFILKPEYFNINFIPIPEFSVWKFGVALVVFGDAGKVWYNKELFKWQNFNKGYGFGLNFILPYHLVLRLEYAMNEYNKSELIFDLYSSF